MSWEPTKVVCKCGSSLISRWTSEINEWQNLHKVCLNTVSPIKEWVGLTEDDKVLIKHDANYNQFMTAGEYADRVQALTEARLKDKNT